ncbi:phasin family protein [Sphingomonas turrisvirgatae]|uniref:Phasin domain-containing protein n=1 Tax=Sphingomonas turrisvirgatae TaxID=1888892 RepID=A0A1E3LU11_9SPHN|nr:phasin family protein [Sphingomonas turrisvirgatae]ODP37233.1 hypothetical protein BFL28_03130 [Sphingomonas turrisvirgatae]
MPSKLPGPGKKSAGKIPTPQAKVAVPFADIKAPEVELSMPAAVASQPQIEWPVTTTVEPEALDLAPTAERVAEPIVEAAEVVADRVTETVEQVASAPLAEPVVAPIEQTASQAAETAVQGKHIMETTIEKTQAFFADFNEKAKAQVEKNTALVGEATEFAKGNVEALVESGKIAAKGFETLGQDAADYGRRSFENATAVLKSMSAVKSPADFFKLQSDFVRSHFDSMVAETSKNTEAMIKLAGDAAQPLSSRFALAVEKVKTAA